MMLISLKFNIECSVEDTEVMCGFNKILKLKILGVAAYTNEVKSIILLLY